MGATKYGSRLELELGLGWAGSRPVWASGSWLLAPCSSGGFVARLWSTDLLGGSGCNLGSLRDSRE